MGFLCCAPGGPQTLIYYDLFVKNLPMLYFSSLSKRSFALVFLNLFPLPLKNYSCKKAQEKKAAHGTLSGENLQRWSAKLPLRIHGRGNREQPGTQRTGNGGAEVRVVYIQQVTVIPIKSRNFIG